MTDHEPTPPTFRVHRSGPALLRGAIVAALCAALTAGFIAQTSGAPAPSDASVAACANARDGVCS